MKLDEMLYVGEKNGKVEERIYAIKKMINLSRKLNASNDFILKQLTDDYGAYFSQEELKQFIKNN